MEEKNELNDIILSKGGANSNSKKLLLAIAALTLILIIVLVIMNSLKTQSDEKPPIAAVPPEPTAPTEIIDDPLFEPVEVIQEGAGNASQTAGEQDLGQIAQKIKEESMQNAPVTTTVIQNAPVNVTPQATVVQTPKTAPVTATPKVVSKPAVESAPKTAPVNTPTIKTAKPAEVKKTAEPKKAAAAPKTASETASHPTSAAESKTAVSTPKSTAPQEPKATDTAGTYYIQVGSFTKEPNKALFDRLNASGLKYTTVPSGAATKVMVGPFQGEKAARDVLGTVKRNIESGAYIVKG